MSDYTIPLSVRVEDLAPSTLTAVYQSLMSSRVDFRVRIWETIKTAGLLFGGTLAATGGIAARQGTPLWALGILGIGLIFFGGFLAWWSYVNVWREQRLQFYDEFAIYQIEELLGLHRKIPEEMQWLRHKSGTAPKKEYEYLFDNKHLPPGDPERKKTGNSVGAQCARISTETLRTRILKRMTLIGLLPKEKSDDAVDDYVNGCLQGSYFLKLTQNFCLGAVFGPFLVFGMLLIEICLFGLPTEVTSLAPTSPMHNPAPTPMDNPR